MKPEGRNTTHHFQNPKLSSLFNSLGNYSTIILAVLPVVPAFLFISLLIASCRTEPISVSFYDEEEANARDSVDVVDKKEMTTRLELSVGGKTGEGKTLGEMIDAMDVFVYEERDTRELESHVRISVGEMDVIDGKECLLVKSGSDGPRTVVVMANCPRSFNMKALSKMDSMELLEYEFLDENTARPMMSGKMTMNPGVDSAIVITPLLCEVVVRSVSNGLDDYELLEEPSVRLCDINPSARVLQQEDFSPSATISKGVLHTLPTDVGFYTKYPDISLYCYPNDTDEFTLGVPRTNLEFNCKIKGEQYSFPFELPPMGRGDRIGVDIIINGFEFQQQNVIFTD